MFLKIWAVLYALAIGGFLYTTIILHSPITIFCGH